MQAINRQILNQIAQCYNKSFCHLYINHGMNNFFIIDSLIIISIIHMKKLINHISKFLGHFLTHFGTGIFRRNLFTNLHQSINRNPLPVLCILPCLFQPRQIPLRIINQVGQLHFFFFLNNMSESVPNLFPNNSGRAAKQMNKCFILPMQITEKILCPFWQSTDCHQIDNLTGSRLDTGIFPCQQFQICQIPHFYLPCIPPALLLPVVILNIAI